MRPSGCSQVEGTRREGILIKAAEQRYITQLACKMPVSRPGFHGDGVSWFSLLMIVDVIVSVRRGERCLELGWRDVTEGLVQARCVEPAEVLDDGELERRARAAQRSRIAIHLDRLHADLADHGVLASVGSVGDAYDNALAESFVDSFKTELIADRVWRTRSQFKAAGRGFVQQPPRKVVATPAQLPDLQADLPPAWLPQSDCSRMRSDSEC